MAGRTFLTTSLAVGALLAAAAPQPAVAGPPWIAIELPANPFSSLPRDAFLLVRAYHHFTPITALLRGTADGLVNGEKRSLPLEIAPTEVSGLYVVRRQWPREGVWVLRITLDQGHGRATAVVGIGTSGEINLVRVPTGVGSAPRPASDAEVGAMLRALAAGTPPAPFVRGVRGELTGRVPPWLVGSGALLAGLPLGLAIGRRRRRAA
jgi:hypothetical protein